MEMSKLNEFMKQGFKRMHEDPIGFFTDKDGNVRVYFDPDTYSNLYSKGYACTGSTESLSPNDIIQRVPVERIKSITHGGVIVEIKLDRSL